MRIEMVPCLRDNYAYLVAVDGSSECVVVDPSEVSAVASALHDHGLRLAAILNTHHHHDHVGGNEGLLVRYPGIDVFGHVSDRDRIPGQNRFLRDGDKFEVAGLKFSAMHVPGHTRGAVAYLTGDVVFTGDTLFAAGCGRLFEGTPRDMYESLNEKLATLPDATFVYCGHEYTENNLSFAVGLEPNNQAVQSKLERVRALRARGLPSLPSTLAEERATNPFMRTSSEELIHSLGLEPGAEPTRVLASARAAKDKF